MSNRESVSFHAIDIKLQTWDHAVHSLPHQASRLYNYHKRKTAAAAEAAWRKKLSLIKFAHDNIFHHRQQQHVRSLHLPDLRIPPS